MIRFVVGPDRALVPDLAAAAARSGNLVERAGGCGRNRPHTWGAFARAARGAGGGAARSYWHGLQAGAGTTDCRASWPGPPRGTGRCRFRQGAGVAAAGRAAWSCRLRTAAPRSGDASSGAGHAGGGAFAGGGAGRGLRPRPRGACGGGAGQLGRGAADRGGTPGRTGRPDGGEAEHGRAARQAGSPARSAGAPRNDGQRQDGRRQDGRLGGTGAGEADRRTGMARQAGR